MKRPRNDYAAKDFVSEARENTKTVRFVREKNRLFFVRVFEAKKITKRTQHEKSVMLPVADDAVSATPAEVPREGFVVHVEIKDLCEMEKTKELWFGSWL